MNFPHFVRVDQESDNGESQHYVVHTHDPKMAVKFSAETVNGKVRVGSIKRISVPNSWAGEYSQYARLVSKAEAFFRASLDQADPDGPSGAQRRGEGRRGI